MPPTSKKQTSNGQNESRESDGEGIPTPAMSKPMQRAEACLTGTPRKQNQKAANPGERRRKFAKTCSTAAHHLALAGARRFAVAMA